MSRAVVIYDGQCELCIEQARRLAGGKITLRSLHDDGVFVDYPDLTYDACLEELKLAHDGRIFGGAEAVARALLIRHRILGKLALGYYIPGVRSIANATYRWVAKNRYRIAGKRPEDCETGSCRRHKR